VVGWHYGFAAAGVGMLIGLGVYLAGRKHLPPDKVRRGQARPASRVRLESADWRAIWGLVALLPILAVAFVGNNQIYNVYMIWAREHANLTIGGWKMPVTWLQSYDATVSVAGLVFAVWFWRRMAGRGFSPHELGKLTIGCAVSILGFTALAAAAAIEARTGAKVPLAWLLAFHVINTLGYVNILPVALALFSRAAPPSVNATMIGVFYLLFFAANLMVGWIGGLYGAMTPTSFWSLHAGLCAASTGALILLWRPLKAALAPRQGPTA
jgi:POT family proton-dependent oligopeptide transporter